MSDPFDLGGKRALVTGGSRGIGYGIAAALARAGAEVVLVARDEEKLEAARAKLDAASGKPVHAFAVDLAQSQTIGDAYDRIVRETGPLDILVNNAGITRRGASVGFPLEDWELVQRVNVTAVFELSRAFARERIASSKGGKIVNIASLASEVARPTIAAYAASKGAIKQLTKALAVEWAPHGINVNAIGPGYIATEMTKPLIDDERFDCWIKQRTPLGRWGTPEDLAGAAVFLAAAASDFLTGQILYVDGGILAAM